MGRQFALAQADIIIIVAAAASMQYRSEATAAFPIF
jgi:hypothetical protein